MRINGKAGNDLGVRWGIALGGWLVLYGLIEGSYPLGNVIATFIYGFIVGFIVGFLKGGIAWSKVTSINPDQEQPNQATEATVQNSSSRLTKSEATIPRHRDRILQGRLPDLLIITAIFFLVLIIAGNYSYDTYAINPYGYRVPVTKQLGSNTVFGLAISASMLVLGVDLVIRRHLNTLKKESVQPEGV